MATDPNPLDDPADAEALRRHAGALADAVDAAIEGWVARSVADRYRAWAGEPPPPAVAEAAARAGERARVQVGAVLRALLATDVDEQRDNPLAVLRRAAGHPTGVLAAAGVPPVDRDAQAERIAPDDAYDLGPAAFADLHPAVHEAGVVWGAAKAHVVLARRRREGRR